MAQLGRPSENRPPDTDVVEFLRTHHGAEPTDLEVLGGGFWSAAFGYRIGRRRVRAPYRRWSRRVPSRRVRHAVYDRPRCRCRRCSRSAKGSTGGSRSRVDTTVASSKKSAPTKPPHWGRPSSASSATSEPCPTPASNRSPWRDWLLAGVTDRPGRHTSGWRQRLTYRCVSPERTFQAADRSHPFAARRLCGSPRARSTPTCSTTTSLSPLRPTP